MDKIKNIIFDLDGTLWDSRKQIIESWQKVLNNNLRIELNEEILARAMGKSSVEFKSEIFNNIDSELADYYFNICQKEEVFYLAKNGANIYANCISTIKELSNTHNLFIVSNCQKGYIESFLNHYDLNRYFIDYKSNGETGLSKQENIELIIKNHNLLCEETCYVGDTMTDYIAANANNILFIFAKYGFGNSIESKYSIDDISKIINLLANKS